MNGRKPSTPRSENAIGLACRLTPASHGIASCDTCEPSSLIDWPVQSFRKSPWPQSAPLGRRRLRIVRAVVQGGREAVRASVAGVVGGTEVVDELLEPARQ